ncbi:hypothetical protein [Nostoc sp. FACHB-110]|uniref:hypothetical protein n=1 Tax=Nostoc sp. FACHB-110 TaxID=2692834 RepID=UPI0016878AF5|nr:hypothetical protein [Nostoc sp. FACHB-110]MBD2440533.1 hypothetical protein [Nostoc sp. FACHB-110]
MCVSPKLIQGRDNPDLPTAVAFSPEQQQSLLAIAPAVEGKTQLQQNTPSVY